MTVQVRCRICVQSHPSACAVNIVLTGVTLNARIAMVPMTK